MLAFKWNALIKTIKLDQPRSVSLHTQAVCLWNEWALQPPHFASFQTHAYGRGASFIWCTTFLLPGSGFCLLALCRCCRCCFLGFVFGCGLCSGGGWGRLSWSAGGFGGLRGLWGSVGRMSPTPPFIPSRGRGTPPPAAIVSYRGLQRVITRKQSVTTRGTIDHSRQLFIFAETRWYSSMTAGADWAAPSLLVFQYEIMMLE